MEHAYRKLYACSHEEYLSEPADTVTWLLHIHFSEEAIQNERQNSTTVGPQGNFQGH